jgi:uncharacterized protein (TIGR00369 family)
MTIKSWDPQLVAALRHFMCELIPFNRHLGLDITVLEEGFARVELPFRPELIGDPSRPAIHGGVIAALIDATGGAAIATLGTARDKISTIDMRVDYLRPGSEQRMVCDATVTRMGGRVASVDMKVYHPQAPGELIATGKGVYNVKRFKPPE